MTDPLSLRAMAERALADSERGDMETNDYIAWSHDTIRKLAQALLAALSSLAEARETIVRLEKIVDAAQFVKIAGGTFEGVYQVMAWTQLCDALASPPLSPAPTGRGE